MPKHICINKKISPYNKTIQVSSDKSLSIRTILLASQAVGISKISNLLESEDVLNTLKTIKKLGINYKKKKNCYEIYRFVLNRFNPKKNTEIKKRARCCRGQICCLLEQQKCSKEAERLFNFLV